MISASQELDWLTMSLDGDSNATQSRDQTWETLDRVMEVLAYAAVYPERNCRIKLNTVVSNKNQNEVKNMVPIVLEKGVTKEAVPVCPSQRCGKRKWQRF